MTEIYLVEEDAWARARSGVMPYFGWHVGVKKSWSRRSHVALSYRGKQASKIEFGVKGEVDFASVTLPLDAAGVSQILFEPRRMDLRFQQEAGSWVWGLYTRWSHWRAAPKLGLVIDSELPEITTLASSVQWQNQIEVAGALAKEMGAWTPVLSYRYKSKAMKSSNDYYDYAEHITAIGSHVELLSQELWLSGALRFHKLVGGGELYSLLASLDWSL